MPVTKFRDLLNRHGVLIVSGAFVLGVVVTGLVAWGVGTSLSLSRSAVPIGAPTPRTSSAPQSTPPPQTITVSPNSDSVTTMLAARCALGTVVSTAQQLTSALASAVPGTTISLAAGTYRGNFVASVSGTAASPIALCGTTGSILDGGNISKGYVFHLNGASFWQLLGFTVQNGQKGVMLDSSVSSVIDGLTVTNTGDEGIHLRSNSTDNLVIGNTVNHTGLHNAKFGEGIYVGTAKKNWCLITNCNPDTSDRNVIEKNIISHTTAENIDIKEGTSDGIIRNNSLNGAGLSAASAWVNVKGNGWKIDGNSGVNSPKDGFQTHNILGDWGDHNIFSNNISAVNGPGFGIALRPAFGNVVECNNTATGAASGTTNIKCSG